MVTIHKQSSLLGLSSETTISHSTTNRGAEIGYNNYKTRQGFQPAFDFVELFEDKFAGGMKLDSNYENETKEEESNTNINSIDQPTIMSSSSSSKSKKSKNKMTKHIGTQQVQSNWTSKNISNSTINIRNVQEMAMDDLSLPTFDAPYSELIPMLEVPDSDMLDKFDPLNVFVRELPTFPVNKSIEEDNIKNKYKRHSSLINEMDFADLGNFLGEDVSISVPTLSVSHPKASRRNEDWAAYKPKLKRAKSMPENGDVKRRLKWSHEELTLLWRGILKEGNNWKEISRALQSRSYFQIKDKGRRLLFLRGWTTGRNKNDTDDGNRKAKAIARRVLTEMGMGQ